MLGWFFINDGTGGSSAASRRCSSDSGFGGDSNDGHSSGDGSRDSVSVIVVMGRI